MPLTINAVSFRMPNAIQRGEIRNVSQKRSVNGTLNTDIMSFAKKTEFTMQFNLLTTAELATLKTYIDTGAYTVIITDTDYAYNASSILSFDGWEETYAGRKKGIKVKVQQI
jgi:hypothetical protein